MPSLPEDPVYGLNKQVLARIDVHRIVPCLATLLLALLIVALAAPAEARRWSSRDRAEEAAAPARKPDGPLL